MPIYEYCCPICLDKEEIILPVSKRNSIRIHFCGQKMERLMSIPQPAIMHMTNTDFAYKTLNREDGYGFPANKHRERYERHFAQGLNLDKPVIGRGFG